MASRGQPSRGAPEAFPGLWSSQSGTPEPGVSVKRTLCRTRGGAPRVAFVRSTQPRPQAVQQVERRQRRHLVDLEVAQDAGDDLLGRGEQRQLGGASLALPIRKVGRPVDRIP